MHIGLDHHRQFLSLTSGNGRKHLLNGPSRTLRRIAILVAPGAVFCDFARPRFGLDNDTGITCHWCSVKTQDLHWLTRPCCLQILTAVVKQRADTATLGTDDKNITPLQRTTLDQQGRNRTTAPLNLRLNDTPSALRSGLAFNSSNSACSMIASSSLSSP